MKIAIDLDEVLADYVNTFLDYHNATYKTSFNKQQIKEYAWWKLFNCTKEEIIKRAYNFYETKYFRNLRPIRGSIEAVSILARNHNLSVITSRPSDIKQETLTWLNRYFPQKFSEVYFTNEWSKSDLNTNDHKKSDLCKKLEIPVIIEDAPETSMECAESGMQVLLYDCPWNKKIQHPKIQRIKSWPEALREISKLSEPQNP